MTLREIVMRPTAAALRSCRYRWDRPFSLRGRILRGHIRPDAVTVRLEARNWEVRPTPGAAWHVAPPELASWLDVQRQAAVLRIRARAARPCARYAVGVIVALASLALAWRCAS